MSAKARRENSQVSEGTVVSEGVVLHCMSSSSLSVSEFPGQTGFELVIERNLSIITDRCPGKRDRTWYCAASLTDGSVLCVKGEIDCTVDSNLELSW